MSPTLPVATSVAVLFSLLTIGSMIAILLGEVETNPFCHAPTIAKILAAHVLGVTFSFFWVACLGPVGLLFCFATQGWFLHRFLQQEYLKAIWWAFAGWGFIALCAVTIMLVRSMCGF